MQKQKKEVEERIPENWNEELEDLKWLNQQQLDLMQAKSPTKDDEEVNEAIKDKVYEMP